MAMADEVIHMERACRGCLREGLHMQPLFPAPAAACGEPRLNIMLMSSTQLQIAENDGLPCQMCVYCTDQLSSAFTFKQMCERSDARLRLYVSKNNPSKSTNHQSSDHIKEEGISRITKNNDIIDFNSLFNHDMHSVKMERENGDNPQPGIECDKSRLNDNKSDLPLNLINSNEKCTQTRALDLVQKIFNCSECSKKFSSVIGLKTHMKFQHDMRDVTSCTDCDKIFAKHSYLKKHCLEAHGKNISDDAKIPLDCTICKKSFQYVNNLKQHMLVHGKKKIYNCEVIGCQRGFNRYQNFEKHKAQCTKNLHTCTVCSKDFASASALAVHSEKHANGDNEDVELRKDVSNSISDKSKNDEESNQISALRGDMEYDESDINIKEEPLEELLEEAERENRLLNDDSNSIAGEEDDLHSMGDYSEEIESDASEYLSDVKVKRKVGRPCKSTNKKYKFKLLKRNENDPRLLKYHCSQCPRKLSSSLRLKIHMAKHYSDQGLLYACEDCGKTFSKSSELKKHERLHITKQFKCNSCDKSFHRQENLQKHMWQHMETKPFQCDKCSKGFMREEHLERHKLAIHSDKKKNPKTAFCTICNRGFTTEKYLETHMRMHTGDKTYTCKICDKSFNTKWHLKEHSKWHSAEKPFLCSECGQRFIRNDYLITHMRRHNGEKPYKCKFCNKGFPRATDLTVHERYHTGEKTHLCTVCGKGFQRQYNLTVHLRVHTGEKPYVCTYCGKRFAQGNDLKSHVRRHTGERFNCEICGEGFIQGYHLTQHKRGIHGIQCTSHIRRVEKHPQGNSSGTNPSKHRNRSSSNQLTTQLASTVDNQLQDNINSSQITNTPAEGQNTRCVENEQLNIPQHCSVTLQSQLAAVQSAAVEVDLSQRAHAMPALMPIVPLALFPNMHSRI